MAFFALSDGRVVDPEPTDAVTAHDRTAVTSRGMVPA